VINRTLPLCFHPTTIVLVDDDKNLLDAIGSHLSSQFMIKKFSSPVEALKFFRHYQDHPFTKYCSRPSERFLATGQNFRFELESLYHTLFDENRFQNVSVIVSDFSMPEMTGAQMFNELYPLNCKKILFTGEASDHEGLQAFNDGVIDRFCRKSASTVTMSVIFEDMQLRYFQEKTHSVLSGLEAMETKLPDCMKNSELTAPLIAMLKARRIMEFYLVSLDGYFLTVTDKGELQWLIVHSADEIDTLYNMVAHLDQDSPSAFAKALSEDLRLCHKTLFFPKSSEANTPIENTARWESFSLPTQRIFTSDQHFYYAFKRFDPQDLPLKPFICFDQAVSLQP
jgi:CheY-like chemotaxis protein